jgi:hypothetical protein
MPTITFKVSADEAARIRCLARQEGRTVSEFLRRRATLVDASARSAPEYHIEISPVTGLPVLRATNGTTVASSDEIRERLVDFP